MTDAQSTPEVLYRERQWVPLYWWVAVFGVVILLSYQLGMGRNLWWSLIGFLVFGAAALWSLLSMSRREIVVTRTPEGVWLHAGPAKIPADVISRTIVVPASAKSAAMGRQLDPEAYVVSRAWVPEMAMLVLDDPQDPTPYWLLSSKNPQELLNALGRPIY